MGNQFVVKVLMVQVKPNQLDALLETIGGSVVDNCNLIVDVESLKTSVSELDPVNDSTSIKIITDATRNLQEGVDYVWFYL